MYIMTYHTTWNYFHTYKAQISMIPSYPLYQHTFRQDLNVTVFRRGMWSRHQG